MKARATLGTPVVAKDLELETNLLLGTIRNAITVLKRQGKVRATGEKVGQAEAIEITELGTSALPFAYQGGRGGDAEETGEERF